MGVFGRVDRELDSRSQGLRFDSPANQVYKCWANFSFHAAPIHSALIGTWWNE